MPSVLEYLDYRKFMRDYYEEKKLYSSFSWREFAGRAGYSSPVFLKLVCDGKNGLSRKVVARVAAAMDLVGLELEYFQNLVVFNQARRDSDRVKALANMRGIAKECKVSSFNEDVYDYLSSWLNPTIRELATILSCAGAQEMARHCVFKTNPSEVEAALSFLLDCGMLRKNGSSGYVMSEKNLTTGDTTVTSLAIRNFHRQMGSLALETLDSIPVSERNFSALTIGLSKAAYEEVAREIESFRHKVVAIANRDKVSERVYQMNFQLFPLTYAKSGQNEE